MRASGLAFAVVLALAEAQERQTAQRTPVIGTAVEVVQVDAVVVDSDSPT